MQNLEGGIVADILVREGEIVEPGQVLMRTTMSVRPRTSAKGARHYALVAALARLEAEVEETGLSFPPEVMEAAAAIVSAETRLFNSRQDALRSELEILRRQKGSASRS